MKKTIITINNESFKLFFGISSVYGEFILETAGDPTCLNELEDTGCEELIETIDNVLVNPDTYWEPCDDEDEQYISGWLNIWGIDHD